MKSILSVITGILCMVTICPAQEDSDPVRIIAAQEALQSWLAFVDNGEYSLSWEEAASMFQMQVTEPQWVEAVKKARKPLGRLLTRTEKSAQYHSSLPGVPDGDYVVVVFQSSFEKKKKAQETVTVTLEHGEWRVAGYFVK